MWAPEEIEDFPRAIIYVNDVQQPKSQSQKIARGTHRHTHSTYELSWAVFVKLV